MLKIIDYFESSKYDDKIIKKIADNKVTKLFFLEH